MFVFGVSHEVPHSLEDTLLRPMQLIFAHHLETFLRFIVYSIGRTTSPSHSFHSGSQILDSVSYGFRVTHDS